MTIQYKMSSDDERKDINDDPVLSSNPLEEEPQDYSDNQSDGSSNDDHNILDKLSNASWDSSATAGLLSSKSILNDLVRPIFDTNELTVISRLIDDFQSWFKEVETNTHETIDLFQKINISTDMLDDSKELQFYDAEHVVIEKYCKFIVDGDDDDIDEEADARSEEKTAQIANELNDLFLESEAKLKKCSNGPSSPVVTSLWEKVPSIDDRDTLDITSDVSWSSASSAGLSSSILNTKDWTSSTIQLTFIKTEMRISNKYHEVYWFCRQVMSASRQVS